MKLLLLLMCSSAYVAVVHCSSYPSDLCRDNHCHKNARCKPYPDLGYYDCICEDDRKGPGFKCYDICFPQETTQYVVGTPDKNHYNVEDTVTYTCIRPGYIIHEDYNTATCVSHKTWNRVPPTCIQTCTRKPGVPVHGRITNPKPSSYVYRKGDRAWYACNERYALKGSKYRDCVDGKWTNSVPVCVSYCLTPKLTAHLKVSKTRAELAESVTYTCEAGFELVRAKGISRPISFIDIACISHGIWSEDPPTCRRKKCTKPVAPKNGYIEDEKDTYYYGDEVFYACFEGYRLNPVDASKVCSDDGTFQPEGRVTCTPIPCSKPMAPNNGYLVKDKNSYDIGEVEGYKCNDGYRMSGSKSTTCLLGPSWSNGPPTCILITCGRPMPGPNSSFKTPPPIRNSYVPDEYVEGECDRYYRLIGTDKVVCVRDGDYASWSTPIVCELITCNTPSPPRYGYLDKPLKDSYNIGDIVKGGCDVKAFYQLDGDVDYIECVYDDVDDVAIWTSFQCYDSCKGRCDKYFPGRRCACRHELCGPRKGRQCCRDIDICGRPSYP